MTRSHFTHRHISRYSVTRLVQIKINRNPSFKCYYNQNEYDYTWAIITNKDLSHQHGIPQYCRKASNTGWANTKITQFLSRNTTTKNLTKHIPVTLPIWMPVISPNWWSAEINGTHVICGTFKNHIFFVETLTYIHYY